MTVKNCYSTAIKGDYTKKSGIVYCTGSSGTSAGRAVLTNCYSVNGDTSPDTTNVSKTNCYLGVTPNLDSLGNGFFADENYENSGLPVLSISLLCQGTVNGPLAVGTSLNVRNHKFTDFSNAYDLVPFTITWYASDDKQTWNKIGTEKTIPC